MYCLGFGAGSPGNYECHGRGSDRIRAQPPEWPSGAWRFRTGSRRRIVPVAQQIPIGSGDRPRFALFAESSSAISSLVEKFEELLDPNVRPPLHPDGMWLVRPDGYTACVAKKGDTKVIADYLEGMNGVDRALRRGTPALAGAPRARGRLARPRIRNRSPFGRSLTCQEGVGTTDA